LVIIEAWCGPIACSLPCGTQKAAIAAGFSKEKSNDSVPDAGESGFADFGSKQFRT